jgi:hypothetical protein
MANKVKKTVHVEKTMNTATFDGTAFLQDVELKAYELYLMRQSANMPGDDLSDWLKAESDMKRKYKMQEA